MPSIDPPSTVPVCTDESEINAEKRAAATDHHPFVAVTNVEGTAGWQATYEMTQAGEGGQSYLLRDEAVDELSGYHREFQQYAEQYGFNDGCSFKSGSLHGLSEDDARDLAALFADVVWDTDNWEPYSSTEVFL